MITEDPYPFQVHLGFVLAAWEEGFARFDMPMTPALGNRHGALHGGAIATLLDTAMGYAGCWTGDPGRRRTCVTLSMNVNYLAPARGSVIRAEAQRTGGGRKTFFADSRLLDEDGTLLSTATGVFRYITRKETP